MKARFVTCSVVLALLLTLILSTGVSAEYGSTNLALGKAIAPLTGTVQGTPENVTDGSDISVWYSYQADWYNTCSFILDLGAEYSIGKIDIRQLQTHRLILESSPNGTDWTVRTEIEWGYNYPDPVSVAVDGAYSARYFRYTAVADWNQYVGIAEFAVYAWEAGPTPTATAVATPSATATPTATATAVPTATPTALPTVTPDPPAPPEVPEPGTIMLLASGLAGMGGFGAFRMRLNSKRAGK